MYDSSDTTAEKLKKSAPHIIAIAILILVFLILMVRFGYMRCDSVPGLCTIYYGIFGEPRVAIVYGEGAIGDPDILEQGIIEEKGIFPDRMHVDTVRTEGVLEPFDVVIVEGPKNISTSTLKAFAGYVQQGGRLVWVGDAGTGLGENDYMCRGNPEQAEPIYIQYRRREITMEQNNQTVEQCGGWETISTGEGGELDKPVDLKAGLCGREYGEIISGFIEANQSISGGINICEDEDGEKYYEVNNAEEILNCIDEMKAELEPGEELLDMTLEEIEEKANEVCGNRANPWRRGPSMTEAGDKIPGIDFARKILGVDYLQKGDPEVENLFLNPVAREHMLTSGLVESEFYFGEANFAEVTDRRIERNEMIFTLSKGRDVDKPAVVTYQPTGIAGPGNVVYYAFPPEIGHRPETDRGKIIVYNLMRYMIPI